MLGKKHRAEDRIASGLLATLLLSLTLMGCATTYQRTVVKTYSGEDLEREAVSILTFATQLSASGAHGGFSVISIDGRSTEGTPLDWIEFEPGRHTISVEYSARHETLEKGFTITSSTRRTWSAEIPFTITLDAEPGRVYCLIPNAENSVVLTKAAPFHPMFVDITEEPGAGQFDSELSSKFHYLQSEIAEEWAVRSDPRIVERRFQGGWEILERSYRPPPILMEFVLFDEASARERVGRRVRTRFDGFREMPRGTTGTVLRARADPIGRGFYLDIAWDFPGRDEPLGVTRGEYERLLKEIR